MTINYLERYPRLILSLAALIYLIPGTWVLPLVDRDEPRFSRATVEMMERGDYVVPYFNGDYRFDKPPLTYWWMSLHYKIFGVSEIGARLHSTLSALLIALVIYSIARRMGLERPWAVLGGFIWLSSLQVLIHGRIAVADMPLILGTTLAMRGFWDYLFAKEPPHAFGSTFWCVYLGTALAFLAKGPLALLIPGISLGLLAAISRCRNFEAGRWRQLLIELGPGIAVALAIVGAWGIPALIQTKGAYFNIGIGEHVVERGFKSFNKRTYIPGVYYLVAVLVFFTPWVSALWPSVRHYWKERKAAPQGLFLITWAASSFLIFSFYKTQLPHYILPGYPALALLAAVYLSQGPKKGFQLTLWINRIFLGALIIAGITLGVLLLPHAHLNSMGLTAIFLGILSLFMLVASELIKRAKYLPAIIVSFIGALLFWPTAANLRAAHITVQLNEQCHQALRTQGFAYGSGFGEPSLVWYSGRKWHFLNKEQFKNLQLEAGDVLVYNTRRWRLDEDMIGQWASGEPIEPMHDRRNIISERFPDADIQWVQGFSTGNSSWLELAVITQ